MAAYNPYELLRILINRVHFHVETDKIAALKSVDELEQRNVFGSSAVAVQCQHSDISDDGRCDECGRKMRDPINPRDRITENSTHVRMNMGPEYPKSEY